MGFVKAKIPKGLKVLVWPANRQTEPNPSFHPLFEGLQHPIRPYRAFHPLPSGSSFSGLLSPRRHCRRLAFARYGLHRSTFLPPLAPRALPRFCATMEALTPARPVLRLLLQIERRPLNGQASLLHLTRASLRSATNHLTRPITAFLLPAQRDGLLMPVSPAFRPRRGSLGSMPTSGRRRLQSGLRPFPAGSSLRPAESCSSSCRPQVRLQLLPTPPRGGAVTFSYQERASPERGLAPLCSRLLAGALGAASCRDDRGWKPLPQKKDFQLYFTPPRFRNKRLHC
jgi:hypothetical protein